MKYLPQLFVAFLLVFCLTAPAFALGTNITIFDGNGSPSDGSGIGYEDGEVEPGMVDSQAWDLEGFFYDQNNTLSLVGGYNFLTGEAGFGSGDIFIATGDLLPSDGQDRVSDPSDYGDIHRYDSNGYNLSSGYAYDFVLDLDFSQMSYAVYQIDENTNLKTAYYQQNEGSSPWQYDLRDNVGDVALFSDSFVFSASNLPAVATAFGGNSHYLLTGFDLSFLGHGTDFYSHFTMGCGNDNLMGQGTVVPEPSTYLLFAAGGGLLWLTRRKRK